MPTVASIEDLEKVEHALLDFQEEYPDAFEAIRTLIDDNKKIGYRNICRLILGDRPVKLKGEE